MADFRFAKATAERIVMGKKPIDLEAERRRIGEIGDADRAAADLVFIGRADAAAASFSISVRSACGSITTPLPMIASLPGRTTPEGSSDSL